ncbi:MAG: ferrous iron transport protein A [Planctomicrobium sp.]|jgi:ferrous iron transport protein A|nr:ferrous iron transport protein A [Planctomicrobium sp.]
MQNQSEILKTLADVKQVGTTVRIVDVLGDDAVALRLMEMGLTEDEEVELLGFAPLGDPIEFSVRGYRLSLRSSEAARVHIETI